MGGSNQADTCVGPFTVQLPAAKTFVEGGDAQLSRAAVTRSIENAARVLYLPDALLPYHGSGHITEVLKHAAILVQRCRESGLEVDEEALTRAIVFHDALAHLDFRLLGFASAEELASTYAYNFLRHLGCSEDSARKVERIIHASHPLVEPRTPEETIMRAADLWSVGGAYDDFKNAGLRLHREAELRRDQIVDWALYLPQNYGYLQLFLWRMLELTPSAVDGCGRSAFHTSAMSNTLRFAEEVFRDEELKAVVFTEGVPTSEIRRPELHRTFRIVLDPDASNRENLLSELRTVTGIFHLGFVIPGKAVALPVPDQSCDEVVTGTFSPRAIDEFARALRPAGKLKIFSPPTDAHCPACEVPHAAFTLQSRERHGEQEVSTWVYSGPQSDA